MNIAKQTARHLKEVFFGGNLTWVNVHETLKNVNYKQANIKIEGFNNTIVALTYHIGYYVEGVIPVFDGKELLIKDKFSFDHPIIKTEKDWQDLLENIWNNTLILVGKVEELTDLELNSTFSQEKYGNFFRNIHGLIEHTHYHLGQIVVMKKLVDKH